jgi:hypothetical protein
MNVVRLRALTAEEEKAVSVDTKHLWHGRMISGESTVARLLRNAKVPT